jgi:hypothetical protein
MRIAGAQVTSADCLGTSARGAAIASTLLHGFDHHVDRSIAVAVNQKRDAFLIGDAQSFVDLFL